MSRRAPTCRRYSIESAPAALGGYQLFDLDQLRGIVARIAGVAKFFLVIRHGAAKGIQRKICERVRFHKLADLINRMIGRDQLTLTRRVHTVEARGNGG